jgi:hypothetical protein
MVNEMRRAAVAALAVTTACSLLTSFEGFDQPRSRSGSEAGTDAEIDAGPPDPCSHKRWPDPPATGADGDVGELFSAVRAMSMASQPGEAAYGFDLDNLCSCPDRLACVGPQPGKPCDPADSGTDNAANDLFNFFSSLSGIKLDESGLRLGLDTGRFGVVFRLSGWNGEANDPAVQLAAFNAWRVNDGADAGARFDGNDVWDLDRESFVDARIPTFPATSAYVTDGVLVAAFTRLVVKVRIPTVGGRWLLIPVEMRDVHVAARISRSGAGFSLSGAEMGGRMPTASLLSLAVSGGACPGSTGFDTVKPFLCDSRDVPLDPGKDGRDAPCEALSMGIAFDTLPARPAPDAGLPTEFVPCPDASPLEDCK